VAQLLNNFVPFMETEGSLPCSQELTIGQYLHPVYTITQHFSKMNFNVTFPSIPRSPKLMHTPHLHILDTYLRTIYTLLIVVRIQKLKQER